jgi:endoglucanase
MTKLQIMGALLTIIAISIFIFVGVRSSDRYGVPLVFSEKEMLTLLWNNYKHNYIEQDTGRTLDIQQNNITTSEGQSYTMLRAVWMDDKETFDKAYKWSMENLNREEDHLFSWLFGKKADGTYGVLSDRGGYNSATDADVDIALALIFAHKRWNDKAYLDEAKLIVDDVWEKEVIIIAGKPYLVANNLEKFTSAKPIINVSYFAPYAYRIFADIDPDHNWEGLVDTSYEVLAQTASSTLDKKSSVGLPPDWIVINKTTAKVEPTNINNLTTNFGYDALRTPWRIALDYQWNKEPRAKAYLDKLQFLSNTWQANKSISSIYSHDGLIVVENEVPAMYGGIIGYFAVSDPELGKEVYEQKIKFLFNQDTNTFKNDLSYYSDNWVWFGIGLYHNLLPNLAS